MLSQYILYLKEEIQIIHKKVIKADYPRSFINSAISQYYNKTKEQQIDNDEDYIIWPYSFEDEKLFILLKLTFSEQKELKWKDFNSKLYKLAISWKSKPKIKICIQRRGYIRKNVNSVEIIT